MTSPLALPMVQATRVRVGELVRLRSRRPSTFEPTARSFPVRAARLIARAVRFVGRLGRLLRERLRQGAGDHARDPE